MRGYTLEQWGARLADAAPTAGDDDALAVEGQRRAPSSAIESRTQSSIANFAKPTL